MRAAVRPACFPGASHQFQQYYRHGEFSQCKQEFGELKFCMKLKTVPQAEAQVWLCASVVQTWLLFAQLPCGHGNSRPPLSTGRPCWKTFLKKTSHPRRAWCGNGESQGSPGFDCCCTL